MPGALALAAALLLAFAEAGAAAARPNLLFMMTDQQRHDTMSA